jgi:hypothetical protein
MALLHLLRLGSTVQLQQHDPHSASLLVVRNDRCFCHLYTVFLVGYVELNKLAAVHLQRARTHETSVTA